MLPLDLKLISRKPPRYPKSATKSRKFPQHLEQQPIANRGLKMTTNPALSDHKRKTPEPQRLAGV
jgi:hypothetical protein